MNTQQKLVGLARLLAQNQLLTEANQALDEMLTKVAEFYEADLDDSLAGISSLIKPVIMVVLSVLIGGLVIAMYLPIFKKEEIVG
ncbi:MAG: type II secretion system F family protein [Candidatus Methylopumilus sp.]|nr:type II secretion system F family protein [Candidatus Methylopumilus sp.]